MIIQKYFGFILLILVYIPVFVGGLIVFEHPASSELSVHCDIPSHLSSKGIGYPSGQKWGFLQFCSSDPSVQWSFPSQIRLLGMGYPSGQMWVESSIPAK